MKVVNGIDAVEISRVEKSMKTPSFLEKVLGPDEYAYYESKGMKAESIAGAFCAKEAFSKALGTGIRDFSLTDVQVLHDKLGKPYYKLSGNAKRLAKKKHLKFELSITHTETTAFAVATATKKWLP